MTTDAKTQATASAARHAKDLEGIGNSCANELARIVVGHDGAAGEEDPVAQRDRDVAGDLPVDEDVRLEAKIALVEGRLVDRRVGVELVVHEQIHANLEFIEGAMV